MASLWADGWFYISGGGFLISSVLFVFFLGQYRATVEAEDEIEDALAHGDFEPVSVVKPAVKPIMIETLGSPAEGGMVISPEEKPIRVAPPAASVSLEQQPVEKTKPPSLVQAVPAPAAQAAAAAPAPAVERRKSESSTGGISPAVVYLQNLKLQVERMEKEIQGLKSLASQQTAQGEVILKRLNEWVEKAGKAQINAEPAVNAAPVVNPIKKAVSDATMVIEPTVNRFQPAAVPAVAPAVETQKETSQELKLVLPSSPAVETAKLEPAAAAPAPAEDPKPVRKGPVWPI